MAETEKRGRGRPRSNPPGWTKFGLPLDPKLLEKLKRKARQMAAELDIDVSLSEFIRHTLREIVK